jgi:hypothetical protein
MVIKKRRRPIVKRKEPVKAKQAEKSATKNLEKVEQVIGDITEDIKKLAYQFFAERNYEHGHDFDNWLKAEKIIKKRVRINQDTTADKRIN